MNARSSIASTGPTERQVSTPTDVHASTVSETFRRDGATVFRGNPSPRLPRSDPKPPVRTEPHVAGYDVVDPGDEGVQKIIRVPDADVFRD